MVKQRVKDWLMDHPEALSLLFLVASVTTEKTIEFTGKSAASGTYGP